MQSMLGLMILEDEFVPNSLNEPHKKSMDPKSLFNPTYWLSEKKRSVSQVAS